MPTVSFVIPAYNEEAVLGRTLSALTQAARLPDEDIEIIVVDDASTDRTASIAAEHGARVIPVHHRQIGATRNAGARAAGGELLVFVDADTLVNAAVVLAAIAAMRAGAVGGGCLVRFSGRMPFFGRVVAAIGVPLYRWAGLAAGCFVFCTRTAFDTVGGFDARYFAGEEVVLSRALRGQGRFVLLREHVVTSGRKLRTHSARETWAVLTQVLRHGRGAVRQRTGLELWYGERRRDPDDPG